MVQEFQELLGPATRSSSEIRTTRNRVFRGFCWNQLSCRFRLLFILTVRSAQVRSLEKQGIFAVSPREAVFPTFFFPQFIRFAHYLCYI